MGEVRTNDGRLAAEFIDRVSSAPDGPAAHDAYREGFSRLRSQLELYPVPERRASVVFESAATTARNLAAQCLPLGIAVAMHLYPLCVLQCIPLPRFSFARFQRAMLLGTIRTRQLIVANAGSERTRGPQACLVARDGADGILIDGTCEYMSLATVADLVLFQARFEDSDRAVLCAADLRAESVRLGDWTFSGNMRLSDTRPVTFAAHRVPRGRYAVIRENEILQCTTDYQRCWFHLFLAEIYLARLERLHDVWGLRRSTEHVMSLNELSQLQAYALRLLDDFAVGSNIQPLKKTTSAMKLRVSLMAQATVMSLHEAGNSKPADAHQIRADASELGYIKHQPTADDAILRGIRGA